MVQAWATTGKIMFQSPRHSQTVNRSRVYVCLDCSVGSCGGDDKFVGGLSFHQFYSLHHQLLEAENGREAFYWGRDSPDCLNEIGSLVL